ncbi:hypothetical protein PV518_42870 [Streptomyces sp. ND04-05B]|uniref:hypothetical protein n=1 Tax=Streptomyces sp. ND04-05B TaxID=3028693 RepID=UPI0029B7DA08|nr:hypothetical protein [Streptomyces sp. ND04-05B]MDX3068814.1 hypothetical protein [Streptomyces sp. ND04-05B]
MTDLSPRPGASASSPSVPTQNPGDARDLRQLLAVVLDALNIPHGTPGYDRRLAERAMWARIAIKGALEENPADIGWEADFLRGRLRAEETGAADRAVRASVDRAFPVIAEFLTEDRARRGEQQ